MYAVLSLNRLMIKPRPGRNLVGLLYGPSSHPNNQAASETADAVDVQWKSLDFRSYLDLQKPWFFTGRRREAFQLEKWGGVWGGEGGGQ